MSWMEMMIDPTMIKCGNADNMMFNAVLRNVKTNQPSATNYTLVPYHELNANTLKTLGLTQEATVINNAT